MAKQMKSNARSAKSERSMTLKHRGKRLKGKKENPGEPKSKDCKGLSTSLDKSFQGKDK